MQLCEYENQTLEALVAASRLSAKCDCPVTHQNFKLLATAHDCETGLHWSVLGAGGEVDANYGVH